MLKNLFFILAVTLIISGCMFVDKQQSSTRDPGYQIEIIADTEENLIQKYESDRTDEVSYTQLLEYYMQNNLPEKAISHIEVGLETNPNDAHLLRRLGSMYMRLEKIDEAETFSKKAVELNETYAYGWVNMARLEQINGNIDMANEYYLKAATLDPRDPDIFKEAAIFFYNHDEETANKLLWKARQIDPSVPLSVPLLLESYRE